MNALTQVFDRLRTLWASHHPWWRGKIARWLTANASAGVLPRHGPLSVTTTAMRSRASRMALGVSALISVVIHAGVLLVASDPFGQTRSDGEKAVFALTLVEVPMPDRREATPSPEPKVATPQTKPPPTFEPAPVDLPADEALLTVESEVVVEASPESAIQEAAPSTLEDEPATEHQVPSVESQEPQLLFPPTSPIYPGDAMASGKQGCVLARVHVTPQGTVQMVEIVASDFPGVFDDAVINTYKHAQYLPARNNGTPVEARILGVTTFQLEGSPPLFCELQFLELAKSINRQLGSSIPLDASNPLNAAQSR